MKKYLILGLLLLISVGLVMAVKQDFTPKPANPSNGRATLAIPSHAMEVSPGVFYLGKALDKGRVVEGYAIIKYKDKHVKPGTICGNGICEPGENARKCPEDCSGGEDPEEPDTSSCYGFLSKGAKWKTVEDYIVDPKNIRELDGAFVRENIALDISKWETSADYYNILGEEVSGTVDGADLESPDNNNEVYFADVDYENAIAITIVWGIFGGPPPFRELVEWDMIFDDVDFDWSSSGEVGKMDFENIATHELGHSVGLGDLYTSECSEQTMYGYATEGEIKKRTLEDGDIAGVRNLYS